MKTLKVVEKFISIQGEGPYIGRPAYFLRLAGCNLKCKWCDTPQSWKVGEVEYTEIEIDELVVEIEKSGVKLLVITGGEPLLHQLDLVPFLCELEASITITVETNGTIAPLKPFRTLVDRFNISPKMLNSGNPEQFLKTHPSDNFEYNLSQKPIYKFVVCHLRDLADIKLYQKRYEVPSDRIYIMPEGVTRKDQLESMNDGLIAEIIELGYNLAPRLHVLIWNDKKGV